METPSTKERIINTAIMLFSDRGYDSVSMRDIAAEVGIKAGSIYNHFPSKVGILKSLYELYARERSLVFPDIKDVLRLLETELLDDVLPGMSYCWPPQLQDRMDRIMLIACQRIRIDKDSENFIREHFFEALIGIWVPLLNRGIELGKIRAVDTGSYSKMLAYYAFSAAQLNCTSMKLTFEQWGGGLKMFYSLLKPAEESKTAINKEGQKNDGNCICKNGKRQ